MDVRPGESIKHALEHREPYNPRPVCQGPMRVIAVIDDPRAVEKILRHLGAWHDPPAGLSPPGDGASYTYEPCDDADHTPDYENALTD